MQCSECCAGWAVLLTTNRFTKPNQNIKHSVRSSQSVITASSFRFPDLKQICISFKLIFNENDWPVSDHHQTINSIVSIYGLSVNELSLYSSLVCPDYRLRSLRHWSKWLASFQFNTGCICRGTKRVRRPPKVPGVVIPWAPKSLFSKIVWCGGQS